MNEHAQSMRSSLRDRYTDPNIKTAEVADFADLAEIVVLSALPAANALRVCNTKGSDLLGAHLRRLGLGRDA